MVRFIISLVFSKYMWWRYHIWHIDDQLYFIYILTHTHLFGDVAVLINVVKVKGPVELFCDRTPEQHRQTDDEVLKADWTVSVNVKCVEQEVSVGGCICRQKEWGSLIEWTVHDSQSSKGKWLGWGGGLDLMYDTGDFSTIFSC